MRRLVWHNINVISTPMPLFGPGPEDEADVDREIRIEKIERELEDLSGGSMTSGNFGETSPSIEDAFQTRECEFEKAPYVTNINRLLDCEAERTTATEL